MKPTDTDVNRALQAIEATERDENHSRTLARDTIRRYRQATAIDRNYNFNAQPEELRQVFYDAAVRFSRRRWWSRWLR